MTSDKLVKNLLEKAQHLPNEKKARTEGLASEINRLSGDARYKLILDYILSLVKEGLRLSEHYDVLASVSFIPPMELREARVSIYDLKGRDRKSPRAVVERPDPKSTTLRYVPYQSIDIIKSIENDPTNIRHPAILLAIHRWQQIIRYHYAMPSRKKKKIEVKATQGMNYQRTVSPRSPSSKIAEAHLERVGKALLEGAKKRALPKEAALGNLLRWDGREECLYIAWRHLDDLEIKSKRRNKVKLETLKNKLMASRDEFPYTEVVVPEDYLEPAPDPVEIMIEPVIKFLRSEEGERFLNSRGRWNEIKAAFCSWYFSLDKATLRKYRSRGKKQSTGERLNARFRNITDPWSYRFNFSEICNWSSIDTWFSPPVVLTDKISSNID